MRQSIYLSGRMAGDANYHLIQNIGQNQVDSNNNKVYTGANTSTTTTTTTTSDNNLPLDLSLRNAPTFPTRPFASQQPPRVGYTFTARPVHQQATVGTVASSSAAPTTIINRRQIEPQNPQTPIENGSRFFCPPNAFPKWAIASLAGTSSSLETLGPSTRVHQQVKQQGHFSCQTCGRAYRHRQNLARHLRSSGHTSNLKAAGMGQNSEQPAKPKPKPNQTPAKPNSNLQLSDYIRCPHCGSLLKHQSLASHIWRVHPGQRPYHCFLSGCNLHSSFATKSELQQHQLVHNFSPSILATLSSQIPHCEPSSLLPTSPAEVMRLTEVGILTGSGNPRATCCLCGATFACRDNLSNHLVRRHSTIRPHQCPSCPLKFATKPQLVSHRGMHLVVKTNRCDDCGTAYSAPKSLTLHRLRVHSADHRQVIIGKSGDNGGGEGQSGQGEKVKNFATQGNSVQQLQQQLPNYLTAVQLKAPQDEQMSVQIKDPLKQVELSSEAVHPCHLCKMSIGHPRAIKSQLFLSTTAPSSSESQFKKQADFQSSTSGSSDFAESEGDHQHHQQQQQQASSQQSLSMVTIRGSNNRANDDGGSRPEMAINFSQSQEQKLSSAFSSAAIDGRPAKPRMLVFKCKTCNCKPFMTEHLLKKHEKMHENESEDDEEMDDDDDDSGGAALPNSHS